MQRDALDLNRLAHRVARRPGNGRHDGQVLPGEAVEQARLADVRLAGENDVQSGAQQAALLRPLERVRERRTQPLEPTARISTVERVDLLLREVERRLDERAQLDQLIDEVSDRGRELALKAAHRAARRGLGGRLDDVRDRLGLCEIELVVEERPPGELARLGETGAELEAAPQEHLQDHRAAVALELEDVLGGVRVRRGKVEGDAIVDRRARRIAEARARRMTWFGQQPEQLRREGLEARAGHADHADARAPRRGGDRGDRVGGAQRFAVAGLSFPPSIMRVICHCCAIDRTLLTTQ